MLRFFVLLLLFFSQPPSLFCKASDTLFLTWSANPQSTLHLVWVTSCDNTDNLVEFRKAGDGLWKKQVGHHKLFKTEEGCYHIHECQLHLLKPNTTYEFKLAKEESVFRGKTAPKKLDQPLVFLAGGDLYHDQKSSVVKMLQQGAQKKPLFALLGGDLAYAVANKRQKRETTERWVTFLELLHEGLQTDTKRLIPILPVLGNHDIVGGYLSTQQNAPFFFHVFPTPGKQGYQAIDFGSYLSIFLLDSGHAFSVEGAQKKWLETALEKRQKIPYLFALYHVGAYPSYRPFASARAKAIRQHFVPLFEKGHLTAAFEGHDHTLKRTHPLKGNKKDPNGVVYLGDGSLGITQPRTPKRVEDLWYLAFAKASQALWVITLTEDEASFVALTVNGEIIDSTTKQPFIYDSKTLKK